MEKIISIKKTKLKLKFVKMFFILLKKIYNKTYLIYNQISL